MKFGQKYRALYMKTQVRFVVAGDTHSPYKQFCASLSIAVADSEVQFNITHS
jgi:hypothetical protein